MLKNLFFMSAPPSGEGAEFCKTPSQWGSGPQNQYVHQNLGRNLPQIRQGHIESVSGMKGQCYITPSSNLSLNSLTKICQKSIQVSQSSKGDCSATQQIMLQNLHIVGISSVWCLQFSFKPTCPFMPAQRSSYCSLVDYQTSQQQITSRTWWEDYCSHLQILVN